VFGRLFETQARSVTVNDMWGPWYNSGYSVGGQAVNESTAVQLLTVYGCVRLITDSISTLPVDCYRKTGDGRESVPTPVWVRQPTVDLDFTAWCGQILSSLLLHGNAYCWPTYGDNGLNELVPLNPVQVTTIRNAGRLMYFYRGAPIPSPLHIRGLMLPGTDVALSPIEAARQSIGLGLAAQTYGSEFFSGEGNMPGVIEMPRPVQSTAKLGELAEQWRKRRSKGGRGLPGVLDDGAQWKPTGVTNEQAQFLATRQFTAAEIAGQMFLVDPSDLGIPVTGTSLTYASLEQRNLRRVQVTLMPWITRIEAAISALLPQPRYMKFNVDAILRADLKARFDSYFVAEAINTSAAARGDAPLLETKEMRQNEDLAPLPKPPAPVAPAMAPQP
jgi:HK97 family phage portal protein